MASRRIAFLLILAAGGASALQLPQCRHRVGHLSNLAPLRVAKEPEDVCVGGTDGDASLFDDFINLLRKNGSSGDGIGALIKDIFDKNSKEESELARINKLMSWMDSFRPLPKAVVESMKDFYDVFYTYNSNAIEGNTLSMSETQLVLEYGITVGGKTLADHLEVIGHKEAIDYVESLSKKSTAITEFETRNIHNLICRRTMPDEAGRYRTTDVKASGNGYRYADSFLVPQLMTDFVDWANRKEGACHPVEFAAEAHYRFVTIHPFRDGNGRVARLLMNWFLLRAGFPIAVVTNDRRGSYIEALVAAQQGGDHELVLFKKLIRDACEISLLDLIRFACTSGDSRGKGGTFYREFLASVDIED